MSLLAASLYLLCLAFLFGSALYVVSRDPFARLNVSYALLALALLGWVGTLFVFTTQVQGPSLLWLGRANFACAALAAPCAYAFALALAQRPLRYARWLWTETLLLAAISLLTGLVDRAESVQAGQHVSAYGALFPLYLLHIVAFALAAIVVALRPSPSLPAQTRVQLRLVGAGVGLTLVTGFVTNAALPYWYGNFRFINLGTLSTIGFLVVVAYAACVHHPFNVRVLVKRTVILALLIASAKILLIFIGTYFQMVLMVADVTRQVPKDLLNAARTLGAGRLRLLFNVLLPATLPGLMDTCRIMLGWAWTYLVIAEVVATSSGLGFSIMRAQRFSRSADIFVGIVLLGLLGLGTDLLFKIVQHRLLPWAEVQKN